ncbi:MAG: sulfatase-like hydrolase/transferase [Terriglobales bacterium]
MVENKRSLLLITVDCLRADHCGFHGYAPPTTPFLDSLASDSAVISNAMVAGAPTYYSLPAIFASRMPLALGRDVVGFAPDEDTLASALQRAGYATAAFTAANPYISPRFGYHQGFEVFSDFHDFQSSPERIPSVPKGSLNDRFRAILNRCLKKSADATGLNQLYDDLYFQYRLRVAAPPVHDIDAVRKFPSAETVIRGAESWLATLGAHPFFLWIHLMDPHAPYYPSADAFLKLTGEKLSLARARYLNEFWKRSDLAPADFQKHKQEVIDLYDAGIRGLDDQIARLAAFLKQSNRWDDCVFALTADHGEAFLEHGRRFHAPLGLEEEIARVPLLIRAPGLSITTRSSRLFSHLHLAPTLLEILDVPRPAAFQGESLLSQLRQNAPHNDAPHNDAPHNDAPHNDAPHNNAPYNAQSKNDTADTAVAECVHACGNPLNAEARLSARLLIVRDARYKMVMRLEPKTVETIFDLQADPDEKRPLAGQEVPEIRRRLLRIAAEHINKPAGPHSGALRLRARLRDIRLKLEAQ